MMQPGAVVCFYPGVVYRPLHYRLMANFPRVDLINPYLIGRFDGALLDGKPWGHAGGDAGNMSYPWAGDAGGGGGAHGKAASAYTPGMLERFLKLGSTMGQVCVSRFLSFPCGRGKGAEERMRDFRRCGCEQPRCGASWPEVSSGEGQRTNPRGPRWARNTPGTKKSLDRGTCISLSRWRMSSDRLSVLRAA